MLFTHFYLTQGQKLETWFASPASREYFGIKPTTFFVNKLTEESIHW